MIVLAVGYKQDTGKDTFFKLMKECNPSAERVSLAGPLKHSVYESFKEFGIKNEDYYQMNPPEKDKKCKINGGLWSPRDLMIEEGEHKKKIYGEDFYIALAIEKIRYMKKTNQTNMVVITDVRCPIEVLKLEELDSSQEAIEVCFINIEREGRKGDDFEKQLADWNGWNIRIDNNSGITELKRKVKFLYRSIFDRLFRVSYKKSRITL